MKKLLFYIATLVLALSCTNKSEKKKFTSITSFEMMGRDTLNRTDENKMKQGLWVTFPKKDSAVYINDTAYPITGGNLNEVVKSLREKKGYRF